MIQWRISLMVSRRAAGSLFVFAGLSAAPLACSDERLVLANSDGPTGASTHDARAASATTGTGAAGSGGTTSPGGAGGAQDTSVSSGTDGGSGGAGSTIGTSGGAAGASDGCAFDVEYALSPAIATVGIVTWSTDLPDLTDAHIDFGPADSGFSRVAPVDLEEPAHRTLLLGMKSQRDYAFRIVAGAGEATCTSDTFTLTTGPIPESVPVIEREVYDQAAVAPGFIVTSTGLGNRDQNGSPMAFILDSDGDVVWWTLAPGGTGRARMNWEGTEMWMSAVNNGGGGGEMRRVSMDGLDVESHVAGLDAAHHDFTVLPGGVIVTIMHLAATGSGRRCSRIVERSPDGTITDIVPDVSALYEPVNECHPNAIHYHPADDSFTLSDRNPSVFVKFSHTGELLWQFGGENPLGPYIEGTWRVNHGHHLLDDGHFLFFNNGQGVDEAHVLEFILDTTELTADEVWRYTSDYGSPTLGDVQRLPNGNTIVAYSNAGVIQELDPGGEPVQTLSTDSVGYIMHRASLYGPPPR